MQNIEEQSLAVSFFNSHPEAFIDPRPASEKITEIDDLLTTAKMNDKELFQTLMQKCALCELEFGEDSIETVIAETQLGSLYNKVKRYDSAMRHLEPAYVASKHLDNMAENDRFYLAVEYTETMLSLGLTAEGEMKSENLAIAELALYPYADKQTDNTSLGYRRDLYCARMMTFRKRYESARDFYARALSVLTSDLEIAKLCIEAAPAAESAGDKETAKRWFHRAAKILEKEGFGDKSMRLTI